MTKLTICSVDGCGKVHRCKGYCALHYRRFLRNGTHAYKGNPNPCKVYFYEVVIPYAGDDCLAWPMKRTEKGYARIRLNGKLQYVHRAACAIVNGPAPSTKHDAAHICGNGHLGCCNPRPITWATRAQNKSHMVGHGTLPVGENASNAKLTESDVRKIRTLLTELSDIKIAQKFGVGRSTVWAIRAGKSWNHLA